MLNTSEIRQPVWFCIAFFLTLTLVFFLKFQPVNFTDVGLGLDQSWRAALAFAAETGLLFGTDIAFTAGPLAGIHNRQFEPNNAYLLAFFSLLVVMYVAVFFALRLRFRKKWIAVIVTSIFSLSVIAGDTFLFLVPLCTALYGIENHSRKNNFIVFLGSFISGFLLLAKFSIFPLAVPIILILDFIRLRRRQAPICLLIFFLSFTLAFYVVGQPLKQLPAFIQSSLQVSAGYSSAMSLPTHVPDILSWIFVAAIMLYFLVAGVFVSNNSDRRVVLSAKVIVISWFLFIAFKAGFVRHDLHMLISWSALNAAILVVLTGEVAKRSQIGILIALALLSVIPGHVALYRALGKIPFSGVIRLPNDIERQLAGIVAFSATPESWKKELERQTIASLAAIKARYPLPQLPGTVDMIQSDQSLAIANGLDYRPRPTLQEYTTYSPALIARNRSFFESARAPDFLIMTPGSIDLRHPASAEGALWPLFFSKYEPYLYRRDYLVLHQRNSALNRVAGEGTIVTASIGDEIPLPNTRAPIMVSIAMKPTIIGKLLDFFYRPPLSQLSVAYENGTVEKYRLIPAMASEGFLVSPLVRTSDDYLLVSTGHSDNPELNHAKSIRVQVGFGGSLSYEPQMQIKFSELNNNVLANGYSGDLVDEYVKRQESLSLLIKANTPLGQGVERVPEGLQAHAPSRLRLPLGNARKLNASFGIRDGAWQGVGQTEGVCFDISTASETLMKRCLKPRENQNDRGEQFVTVDLPGDTNEVFLQTSCMTNCDWDWSFWGMAILRP